MGRISKIDNNNVRSALETMQTMLDELVSEVISLEKEMESIAKSLESSEDDVCKLQNDLQEANVYIKTLEDALAEAHLTSNIN